MTPHNYYYLLVVTYNILHLCIHYNCYMYNKCTPFAKHTKPETRDVDIDTHINLKSSTPPNYRLLCTACRGRASRPSRRKRSANLTFSCKYVYPLFCPLSLATNHLTSTYGARARAPAPASVSIDLFRI